MARLSRLPALACLLFVLLAPQLQAKPTLHVVYTAENDIVLTCRRANGAEITDALFFNGSEEITNIVPASKPGDYTIDITPDNETALICRNSTSPAGSESSDPLNIFAIRLDMNSESESICPEQVTETNGQFLRFPCDYKPGRLRDLYKRRQWTQERRDSNPTVIVTNNDNYMIEDDYSLLVRQSEVSSGDAFYCTLTIERCLDSSNNLTCDDESFEGRKLQLGPNFFTQLSVTGPDSKNVTKGHTASFTCTATADPGLQDGDVEFRWTVGSDELDCDEDEHCNMNSNSMNNNFQSTLKLNTTSFSVGQTIDVQCTANVTNSPADACPVPKITQSGSLTVKEGVSFTPTSLTTPTTSVTPTSTDSQVSEGVLSTPFFVLIGVVVGLLLLIVFAAMVFCTLICCCRYRYKRQKLQIGTGLQRRPRLHRLVTGEYPRVPHPPVYDNIDEFPAGGGREADALQLQNAFQGCECEDDPPAIHYNDAYQQRAPLSEGPEFVEDNYNLSNITSVSYMSSIPSSASQMAIQNSSAMNSLTLPQSSRVRHPSQSSVGSHTSLASDHSHRSNYSHRSNCSHRSSRSHQSGQSHRSRKPSSSPARQAYQSDAESESHYSYQPPSNYTDEGWSHQGGPQPSPHHQSRYQPSTSQEMMMEMLSCLMHSEDCRIPQCLCHEAKRRFTRLCNEIYPPPAKCNSTNPNERRRRMHLPLKHQQKHPHHRLPPDVHVHHHLTTKSHAIHTPNGRVSPRIKHQRSYSMDLTPITESPRHFKDDPLIKSPVYIPDDPQQSCSSDSPDGGSLEDTETESQYYRHQFLLREISISADNIPAVCVNDCPLTPTPLQDRSLAAIALSPIKARRSSWLHRSLLQEIREHKMLALDRKEPSRASTTSNETDESTTSSRHTTQETAQQGSFEQDAETEPPSPKLGHQESGIESGYDTEQYEFPKKAKLAHMQSFDQASPPHYQTSRPPSQVQQTLC